MQEGKANETECSGTKYYSQLYEESKGLVQSSISWFECIMVCLTIHLLRGILLVDYKKYCFYEQVNNCGKVFVWVYFGFSGIND